MTVSTKILNVEHNEFTSQKGEVIKFNTIVCDIGGRTFKISANKDFDFVPFIGKQTNLDILLTPDSRMQPKVRAVGVLKS